MESQYVSELDMICILSNKKIKSVMASTMEKLINSNTLDELSRRIYKALNNEYHDRYQLNALLISELENKQEILNRVINSCIFYFEMNTNDAKVYLNRLSNFVNKKLFSLYAQNYVSNRDLDSFFQNTRELTEKRFTITDVHTFSEDDNVDTEDLFRKVIPSKHQSLNESLHFGGYLRESVTIVAAPPGRGKTQFMFEEVLHFNSIGMRVLYIALGDMKKVDFISRLCSLQYQVPIKEVLKSLPLYYTQQMRDYIQNINYIIESPAKYSIYDIKPYLENCGIKYDVLVLDYDANTKETDEYDMYKAHEIIYNELAELALTFNMSVFSLSQVKQPYYGELILPEECLAQSSRKQDITDLVILYNRKTNPLGESYGVINVPKSRRGKITTLYCKSTEYDSNEVIDKVEWDSIKNRVTTKYGSFAVGDELPEQIPEVINDEELLNIDIGKGKSSVPKVEFNDIEMELIEKSRRDNYKTKSRKSKG